MAFVLCPIIFILSGIPIAIETEGYKRENVQRDFLKYTAQMIKADLEKNNPQFLQQFKVVSGFNASKYPL